MQVATNLRRHLKTAAMDEIQSALYKATADDKLPPKEKHVVTLVRLAGEDRSSAEHVDAELAKRLQSCRAPRSANIAAKTLVVVHRIIVAGHGDVIPDAARALSAVCTLPQGRNALSDYVADCAAYLRILCAWDGIDALRASAGAMWHGQDQSDVLRSMPTLQQLTNKALDAAVGGRSANAAFHALRHAMIEDAISLFRAQTAGAASLQAGLLSLPTALVDGASVGRQDSGSGALAVLEVSPVLSRKALILQHTLADEADGEAPTPGLVETLSNDGLPWNDEGRKGPSPGGAIPPAGVQTPRGQMTRRGLAHERSDESMRAEDQMADEGVVWEERDLLMRALLDTLPTRALAQIGERVLGRPVESAAQLSTSQLRAIGATGAIHAAKLARRAIQHPSKHPSSEALGRPSAATHPHAPPSLPAGAIAPLSDKSTRLKAVADLDALQQAAGPSFNMPSLALARMPSLSRNTSGGFNTPASPGRGLLTPRSGGSPLGTPRGEGMALPPLPVPLAELRPQLPYEPSAAQLSLAAFELLILSSEKLGAGVRVAEILPNSAARKGGVLAPGDILYTCNDTLLLGARQATAVLRAAADGHTGRSTRLRLLDGREALLGKEGAPSAVRASATKVAPPPFGIVPEAIARPNDAVSRSTGCESAATSARSDELLGAIRTRLNIPLRQQRWLLPILRTPLASDPPPLDPPPPVSPAYRALLLLHAGNAASGGAGVAASAAADSGGAAAKLPAPRAAEIVAFVGRQISLLRNAVASAEDPASCGGGAKPDGGSEGGPAALRRLEAQARRLLSLRFAPEDEPGQGALPSLNEAASSERLERAAIVATLRQLGVEIRVDGTAADISDAALGAASSGLTAPGERPAALLPCWSAVVGYRLYVCLLEAIFESDEPAVLADDHNEVEAFLRLVWAPCSIDLPRHCLALLATTFDHYQHSGAPQLLPLIGEYLKQLLVALGASRGGQRGTPGGGGATSDVMGGADWTSMRMTEVLAGIVGYLSGKLRDYRGNFGCDPDELRACAQLWCASLQALGDPGGGQSLTPRGGLEIDQQARSLIEASMARHMRRLRLVLGRSTAALGAIDESGGERGSLTAGGDLLAQEESLCRLVQAVAEEAEIEVQFACAFDAMVQPPAAGRVPAPSSQLPAAAAAAPALLHSLACLEAEIKADVDGALRSFRTISGSGTTALQALLGLRSKLAELGMEAPLPSVDVMCEQMADGWCNEIPELLQKTLTRSLEGDSGEAISDAALRTSSVVDVFSQLDSLTHVYAMFCALPPAPMPPRVHQRFLELVETQVCMYVMKTSRCEPLPPSSLRQHRRGSTTAKWERGSVAGSDAPSAPPQPQPRVSDSRVEATSLHQLCLRLNDCEWAGEQLLQLAARLRADVPGLGRLPGGAVRQCEQSCRDLLDYITARVVYYELDPLLLSTLYLPTPEGGRLASVLQLLQPILQEMNRTVAPRWAQRLLESVLTTIAIAVGALIELPNRRFERRHKALLDEDVEVLGSFFLREAHGLLEEQVVRNSVAFLHALAEAACGAK